MIRQQAAHGRRLYVPGDGDAASLWTVHADGHGYPQNQDNPATGESWWQAINDGIRPASTPLTPASDSVWSVSISGSDPTFRPNMAAAFALKAYRETLSGTVNGSNTVFTTARVISATMPVAATTNGLLTTASITGAQEVTLATAPATGDTPTIVYWATPS